MLARTVSGVFDKLKSLPSLPGEVISGIRGRETNADRRDGVETDIDSLTVVTDYTQDLVSLVYLSLSDKLFASLEMLYYFVLLFQLFLAGTSSLLFRILRF